DSGGALNDADLAELIGISGLDRAEHHRAKPAGGLAQIDEPGLHGDAVAGANRHEVLPVGAAVEAAEGRHVELDIGNRRAHRAAESGRRDHAAEAGLARVALAVEERIAILDRLGEAANRAALDLVSSRLGSLADLLAGFVGNVFVGHRLFSVPCLRFGLSSLYYHRRARRG